MVRLRRIARLRRVVGVAVRSLTPGPLPEGPGGASRFVARHRFAARVGAFLSSVLPRRPLLPRALAALAFVAVASCRSGEVDRPGSGAPAAAPAPGAPERNIEKAALERKPPKASEPWHIPVGPELEIAPGKGFGPIRFGAKVETIERLIGEPCEEKRVEGDDVLCRYSAQAVEFVLRNGQVVQMRAHRLGRPFKTEPKPDYGIFNGRFAAGVAPGMLAPAVRELLGEPKRVVPVTRDNPNRTVEIYEYDTFSLEFDRLPTDSVVLGGIILNAPR
jgi:hypothetical protein